MIVVHSLLAVAAACAAGAMAYLLVRRRTSLLLLASSMAVLLVCFVGLLALPQGRSMGASRMHEARALIERVQLALERYHRDFGAYPPDTQADRCSLYRYLCGERGRGIRLGSRAHGPYIELGPESLVREGGSPVVVDPWGEPLGCRAEPSHAQARRLRADSYDIYSTGPNGEPEPARHDLVDNDGDGETDETHHRDGKLYDEAGILTDDLTNW